MVVGTLIGGWLLSNYGVQVVRQSLGKWAPLVAVPIHIIVAVSPISSDVVSIANGAVYGFAVIPDSIVMAAIGAGLMKL